MLEIHVKAVTAIVKFDVTDSRIVINGFERISIRDQMISALVRSADNGMQVLPIQRDQWQELESLLEIGINKKSLKCARG